jgi:aminoglycoside phosphotransferase (APT) family kinase protein
LITLYDTAPVLYHIGGTKVVRLSRALVLKGGSTVLPREAQNIDFVATHTQIPVPKVHRVLNIKEDNSYWGTTCFIVMDYVQGQNLATVWANLDQDSRSDITSQVAAMIQQMGSLTLERPGLVGSSLSRFRGVWFSDYGARPFDDL